MSAFVKELLGQAQMRLDELALALADKRRELAEIESELAQLERLIEAAEGRAPRTIEPFTPPVVPVADPIGRPFEPWFPWPPGVVFKTGVVVRTQPEWVGEELWPIVYCGGVQ